MSVFGDVAMAKEKLPRLQNQRQHRWRRQHRRRNRQAKDVVFFGSPWLTLAAVTYITHG
jgi:hypothetical protein